MYKKPSYKYLLQLISSVAVVSISGTSSAGTDTPSGKLTYPVIDTHQLSCHGTQHSLTTCPAPGQQTYGQDAQYQGIQPDYTDNKNGTTTDNNTRLMWANSIDINNDGVINISDKLTYNNAVIYVNNLHLGGYTDWRIPTIKELYSLIMFDGQDPSGLSAFKGNVSLTPFIDHHYFGFSSGDMNAGERLIDAQYLTSTRYVSKTMNDNDTIFGVNFIDGRIKGYGLSAPGNRQKRFYLLAVRNNTDYGINLFTDNNNDTVTDKATGLTWQKNDSQYGMNWSLALSYCENLVLAENSNWRLPNIKELQSIVDYTRSPATSGSAAINPVFNTTSIINEAGALDYPNYWSSTTHKNLRNSANAAYIAFGRSLGKMHNQWMDVHGAGSQRSDPKIINQQNYSDSRGPQGDAIRIDNYVRCVTDRSTTLIQQPETETRTAKVFSVTEKQNITATDSHKPGIKQRALPDLGGGRQAPSQHSRLFSDMDTNHDDKLTRKEIRGPLIRDFDRLDQNGDGYLELSELKDLPPPPKQSQYSNFN